MQWVCWDEGNVVTGKVGGRRMEGGGGGRGVRTAGGGGGRGGVRTEGGEGV